MPPTTSHTAPARHELGVIWDAPLPRPRREHRRIGYPLTARATAGTMVAALALGTAGPVAGVANAGEKPVITLPAGPGGSTGDEGVAAPGETTPEDATDDDGLTPPPPTTEPEPPELAPGEGETPPPAEPAPAQPPAEPAAAQPAPPLAEPAPAPPPAEATPAPIAPPAVTPAPAPAAPEVSAPAGAPPTLVAAAPQPPDDASTRDAGAERDGGEAPVSGPAPRGEAPGAPASPPPAEPAAQAPAPPAAPAPAAAPVAQVPAPTADQTTTAGAERAVRSSGHQHRVRPGESLWTLAERLAGPGASDLRVSRLMFALWDLNEDRIGTGDADQLPVGVVLELPRA